jgi:hypothetical protein
MKLSEHTKTEAKQLLEQGATLPAQITSAPFFYVTKIEDKTVLAFAPIDHNGQTYKIGTLKKQP